MAFKKKSGGPTAPDSPADLFQTLTRRTLPALMSHQSETLSAYGETMTNAPHVALQLPTGSGKTLVGLMIAEWRRRKYNERVVYMCPTRQLVNQTVEDAENKYGVEAVSFTGPINKYTAKNKSDYLTRSKIAVTTYSSVFNTNPFFSDPDIIIVDDAHAAENYIAKMWSLDIPAGKGVHQVLHGAICGLLKPHLKSHAYSLLTGEWKNPSDANWVDKLPTTVAKKISKQLTDIIDTYSDVSADVTFSWKLIREHLDGCQIYLGARGLLIRPLIPPTWTHEPFANAKQRLFMSATLGAGGDLERLTGCSPISRLAAPKGFKSVGVGRRFFIFPGLSLEPAEIDKFRLGLQNLAGRSVVLTPSTEAARAIAKQVETLPGFKVFTAEDIELSKANFIASKKAAAIMAGRFDGIDFPDNECRLLCLDGLPSATNLQEQFLMRKMSASALFNERLQTRVLQAAGRCTRALQDRSAVFVTGHELLQYLVDVRNWEHFHPELQAELQFGVEQSRDVSVKDLVENFKTFLDNGDDWETANSAIALSAKSLEQTPYPAMDELAEVVSHEIQYQRAIWTGDNDRALIEAKKILPKLNDTNLRGYRALWHYLAGSAAASISTSPADSYAKLAREQFASAMKAAPNVGWLARLGATGSLTQASFGPTVDPDLSFQVERLEEKFLEMGTVSDHKFEQRAKNILEFLDNPKTFEEGQRLLGDLLGFIAGNAETDASPDPWWLSENIGVVFEDHADADPSSILGANKAKQAATHPNWLVDNEPAAKGLDITVVIVTPCTKAGAGAKPQLNNVLLWRLDDFRNWAVNAVNTLRELKATLPPGGSLFWRDEASNRLTADGLTLAAILSSLDLATKRLDFSG